MGRSLWGHKESDTTERLRTQIVPSDRCPLHALQQTQADSFRWFSNDAVTWLGTIPVPSISYFVKVFSFCKSWSSAYICSFFFFFTDQNV